MRRCVLIVAVGLAVLAITPIAASSPRTGSSGAALTPIPVTGIAPGPLEHVRVRPRTGRPHTSFRFSLKLPVQLPVAYKWARVDTLAVSGPHRHGCVSNASTSLPTGAGGAEVHVRLNPRRLGGRWCVGRFHGIVTDSRRIICSPPVYIICPALMIAPQVIARFTFRVA